MDFRLHSRCALVPATLLINHSFLPLAPHIASFYSHILTPPVWFFLSLLTSFTGFMTSTTNTTLKGMIVFSYSLVGLQRIQTTKYISPLSTISTQWNKKHTQNNQATKLAFCNVFPGTLPTSGQQDLIYLSNVIMFGEVFTEIHQY